MRPFNRLKMYLGNEAFDVAPVAPPRSEPPVHVLNPVAPPSAEVTTSFKSTSCLASYISNYLGRLEADRAI